MSAREHFKQNKAIFITATRLSAHEFMSMYGKAFTYLLYTHMHQKVPNSCEKCNTVITAGVCYIMNVKNSSILTSSYLNGSDWMDRWQTHTLYVLKDNNG